MLDVAVKCMTLLLYRIMYIELTRRFGNSVLAEGLEPESTNSKPLKPEKNPEQINICHTLCTRHGICESTREHRNTEKVQTTSIQGLTHTGEHRTRRSRTASPPETPDNPLDTRMDHTTHSLDTWAPKIPMIDSNPWHRTYQRTPSGNPTFRHRTLQPVRKNGYPPTPYHRLRWRSHNMELYPYQNHSSTPHRPPVIYRTTGKSTPISTLAPQRQAEIVWIIAHLVEYRMQRKRLLTLNDYIDFLRRAKWKAYQKSPRQNRVWNCLDIIWLRHRNFNRGWITKQLKTRNSNKEKISTTNQTTHRAYTQGSSGKPTETPNPHPTRELIVNPHQALHETSVQRNNNVNLKNNNVHVLK